MVIEGSKPFKPWPLMSSMAPALISLEIFHQHDVAVVLFG
jgi:hypothetical protein